jgi:hypothetical protein
MTMFKWSTTAATNSTVDSTIGWAEGQAPSTVNDSARAMMAAIAKYRDDTSGMTATTGGTTAYVLSTAQGLTTLTDGHTVAFTCNATNTGGGTTLNVDGTGARPLQKIKGTALGAGEIVAAGVYEATYDTAVTASWIIKGGRDQVYNTDLAAIAALTSAADKVPYATGSGTWAMADFTTAGRAVAGGASASAQRTSLGLGTSATVNTGTSGATIPLLNGANTHSAANTFSSSAGIAAPNTAKAFGVINNDGTPAVESGGFNCASVVLDATGITTVTFTNAIGSGAYSVAATAEASSGGYLVQCSDKASTTVSFRTYEVTGGGISLADIPYSFVLYSNQ